MLDKNKFPYYGILIDSDLSPNGRFSYWRYFTQALLGALFFMLFIYIFNYISCDKHVTNYCDMFVATSVASSVFLVFGAPGVPTAHPRPVILGQTIGIFICIIGFYFICFFVNDSFIITKYIKMIFIFFSMFLSLLIMTVFNAEHPPAAGTAVALTIMDQSDPSTMLFSTVFIFFAAAALASIWRFFYIPDGLKAISGIDNKALLRLKNNGILTIEHLEETSIETLENIFGDNKEYYQISSWVAQAAQEPLKTNTHYIWRLKDLF